MMGAKIGDRSQVELGEILNFGNLVQLVIVVINIGLKMQRDGNFILRVK